MGPNQIVSYEDVAQLLHCPVNCLFDPMNINYWFLHHIGGNADLYDKIGCGLVAFDGDEDNLGLFPVRESTMIKMTGGRRKLINKAVRRMHSMYEKGELSTYDKETNQGLVYTTKDPKDPLVLKHFTPEYIKRHSEEGFMMCKPPGLKKLGLLFEELGFTDWFSDLLKYTQAGYDSWYRYKKGALERIDDKRARYLRALGRTIEGKTDAELKHYRLFLDCLKAMTNCHKNAQRFCDKVPAKERSQALCDYLMATEKKPYLNPWPFVATIRRRHCLRSAKLTCGPRSPTARSLGSILQHASERAAGE